VVTAVVNELDAAPDEVVLILDDYHLLEGPPVHDSPTVLLERLPMAASGLTVRSVDLHHLVAAGLQPAGQPGRVAAGALDPEPLDAA